MLMLHGEEGRRDGRGDVSLFLSDSPSRMSLSYFLARRNDWTGLKKNTGMRSPDLISPKENKAQGRANRQMRRWRCRSIRGRID
jgi:hypothetical protein